MLPACLMQSTLLFNLNITFNFAKNKIQHKMKRNERATMNWVTSRLNNIYVFVYVFFFLYCMFMDYTMQHRTCMRNMTQQNRVGLVIQYNKCYNSK